MEGSSSMQVQRARRHRSSVFKRHRRSRIGPKLSVIVPEKLQPDLGTRCQRLLRVPQRVVSGSGGDRLTNVKWSKRCARTKTSDHADGPTTLGAVDESGKFLTMENATNDRKTVGMNGSGFVEMVERRITAELCAERDVPGVISHATDAVPRRDKNKSK